MASETFSGPSGPLTTPFEQIFNVPSGSGTVTIAEQDGNGNTTIFSSTIRGAYVNTFSATRFRCLVRSGSYISSTDKFRLALFVNASSVGYHVNIRGIDNSGGDGLNESVNRVQFYKNRTQLLQTTTLSSPMAIGDGLDVDFIIDTVSGDLSITFDNGSDPTETVTYNDPSPITDDTDLFSGFLLNGDATNATSLAWVSDGETVGANLTPDQYDIPDKTGQAASTTITTDSVQLVGIDAGAVFPVTASDVTVGANGLTQISTDDQATWSTASASDTHTYVVGQTYIRGVADSSATPNGSVTVETDVGGTVDQFSIVTLGPTLTAPSNVSEGQTYSLAIANSATVPTGAKLVAAGEFEATLTTANESTSNIDITIPADMTATDVPYGDVDLVVDFPSSVQASASVFVDVPSGKKIATLDETFVAANIPTTPSSLSPGSQILYDEFINTDYEVSVQPSGEIRFDQVNPSNVDLPTGVYTYVTQAWLSTSGDWGAAGTNSIQVIVGNVGTIGQAVESNSAFSIVSTTNPSIGIARETNEAFPITTSKVLVIGQAQETNEAFSITSEQEPAWKKQADNTGTWTKVT